MSRRPLLALARRLPLVGTLVGIGLAVWLVLTNDVDAVVGAFGRIGVSGLLAITLVRLVILGICGIAWWCLLRGLAGLAAGPFVLLRGVREGINVLLPVASVGGEVVGGRLLTFFGMGGALAAAGLLVDILFQAASQALFALVGVALLTQIAGETAATLSAWFLRGLAVSAVLLGAFLAAQRFGALRVVERGVASLARRWSEGMGTSLGTNSGETRPGGAPRPSEQGRVQEALDAIWSPGRAPSLLAGFALHLLAWFLGAAEIAIALACLGVPFTLAEVLLIESLSQAIKSAAFPVPSGLGIQEGGFVLLAGLYGIDPGVALALSLAKRVPDLVIGLPALLAWQSLEARRLDLARPAPTRPGP